MNELRQLVRIAPLLGHRLLHVAAAQEVLRLGMSAISPAVKAKPIS
jgi:hypothetical protein